MFGRRVFAFQSPGFTDVKLEREVSVVSELVQRQMVLTCDIAMNRRAVAVILEIHVIPRKSVPSYRLHKPSGQARTIIDGRHVYLGKYNSPESHQRYARLLAELAQPGRDAEPVTNDIPKSLLLLSQVLVKYLEYAEVYYHDDGKPVKEFEGIVDAITPVNEL